MENVKSKVKDKVKDEVKGKVNDKGSMEPSQATVGYLVDKMRINRNQKHGSVHFNLSKVNSICSNKIFVLLEYVANRLPGIYIGHCKQFYFVQSMCVGCMLSIADELPGRHTGHKSSLFSDREKCRHFSLWTF